MPKTATRKKTTPPNKARVEGTVRRDIEIRQDAINEETREIELSFSSETPVERGFFSPWLEILGHNEGEVDLSRLNNDAPFLLDHRGSVREQIGVVTKAEIRDRRGVATVRISDDPDTEPVWRKIVNGTVRKISVGYEVREMILVRMDEDGPDEFRVTDWLPWEISLVSLPADDSVGIGRSDGGRSPQYKVVPLMEDDMSTREKAKPGGEPSDAKPDKTVDQGKEDENTTTLDRKAENDKGAETTTQRSEDEIRADTMNRERERRTAIRELLKPWLEKDREAYADLERKCVDDDKITVDQARKMLLDKMGEGQEPAGSDPEIRFGADASDKFREGASLALQQRGLFSHARTEETRKRLRPDRSNEFLGMRLERMAEHALNLRGINTIGMGRLELIGRAFTESDFPNIIQDASHQAMLLGFDESAETWMIWCMTGALTDFKIAHRSGLSSFGDLQEVVDGGEYTHAGFSDRGEPIQLATYGRLFKITRQTIINDELSAFTEVPMKMGRAAARLVGDLAYGILTSNPTMGDGIALFAGTTVGTQHGNLNIGGAAALGVDPLSQMRTAMARQTDESGSATGLNIRPGFLLVPLTLEDTARQTVASQFDPRSSVQQQIPNPIRNVGDVVPDPRLDADSTTAFYLVAARTFDTVEVAFLDGIQEPRLEQRQGWNVDGTEYKVALDTGAAAREWRTFQKNDGM